MISKRLKQFPKHFFSARDEKIQKLRSRGVDIVNMDVGSPDLPPPQHVLVELNHSAQRPENHGYQSHRGPASYRQAWAQHYKQVFDVQIDPEEEVIGLLGSKEGIFNLSLALIDPGDIVLISNPGYVTYDRGTLIAGGIPHYFPLLRENGYLPDLKSIPAQVAEKAKVIWLNYPNNPTAAVATLEFFAEAVEFAQKYGILLCHDAAYVQVNFDGYKSPSILQIPGASEIAVEFNTLSKSHNMAGWRVAAALGNRAALQALVSAKTHSDSGHFLPVLDAATSALTGDQNWIIERNNTYAQRRNIVVDTLKEVGLDVDKPLASLYVWCAAPDRMTSVDFAEAVLENTGVSITPGSFFGSAGDGYVRFSLTQPLERINRAMNRFKDWYNQ